MKSDVKNKIKLGLAITFTCGLIGFGLFNLVSTCDECEFNKGDQVKIKSNNSDSPCNCVVNHVFCDDVQVLCTDDNNKTTELTVHHTNLEICN